MLQPVTISTNGDQDGQFVQQQYQILHDGGTVEQLQQIQTALGEHQVSESIFIIFRSVKNMFL